MTLLHPPSIRPEFQLRHPGRRMTEEEFVDWIGEKTRAEWVDGKVIMMAPVSGEHDRLGWWLRTLVQLYVDAHSLGEVRGSEFMVRLPKQRQRRLPDISFVAAHRANIVFPNHFDAAPDLVMEVVSPSSVARDRREKYASYQSEGVKEYWIVDPHKSTMEANRLVRGKFRLIPETDAGVSSALLPGFRLKSDWLFAYPRPSVLTILKKLGIPQA